MSTVLPFPARRSMRKLMLYSHDTYGLGHIRRNLAIGRHLLARQPGLQVVLVSGSAVGDRFALPKGMSLVQLPPVVKVGPEDYRPYDSRLSLGVVRRARTAIIADVVRRLRPDVLLVDHAPAGMGGELRSVFELVARESPGTRLALGLRDVLDEPETVVQTWSRQSIYALLDEVYDEIYVYGERELYDVGAAYEMPPSLAGRLQYTGYLDRPPYASHDRQIDGPPPLLATAGGGGDGAEVLQAALEVGDRLGLGTLAVTGPLMEARKRAALDARAATTPGARVVTFHPAVGSLMRAASVVVTMGGYNSMCEAVAAGTPTIVVPRTWPRREQALRAELFAERGLVHVVPAGAALGDRLAPVVRELLHHPRRATGTLAFGGLDRLADWLLGVAPSRQHAVAVEELAA